MSKASEDFCSGPLLKKIITYTIPIILTSILQLLFNAADLVVVGWHCGSESVGAVGATVALTHLIVNLFIGISVGVSVTVAFELGAERYDKVFRAVHTAIPMAVIFGAIITVVGVCFSDKFLLWMGTHEDVLELSTRYIRIYFAGMIGSMIYNFGAAILRASGDTKGPLIYLFVSGILNVLLNILFVFVFEMNVAGVALATTISQFASAAMVIVALCKCNNACRLDLRQMRIYPDSFKRIIAIGLPAGIQSSLFSISNVIIQSSINSFNSVAVVSGSAAAGNLEGFVYVAMNSFSQTVMNFTSQNLGAGKYERVKKSVMYSLLSVTVTGLVTGVGAFLLAKPLLSIYIPGGDAESVEALGYGIERMTFVCLPYVLCGIMDVMTGSLRGIGMSKAPMAVCVGGVCVFRIIWIYTVFRAIKSISCLFLSYPISWLLTFVVELIIFIVVWRKREKKLFN